MAEKRKFVAPNQDEQPPKRTVFNSQSTPSKGSAQQQIRRGGSAILVNHARQKDNPVLKLVYNVPWEPDDVIKCDFAVGKTTGVWYLSLRYHRLNPGYIYDRISGAARTYVLRVLLVYVDIENYHEPLRELNRSAILNNFTLMLAWSKEEAARYLETYKVLENTPPDLIRERPKDDYGETIERALTNIRSVNKTDVLTLRSHFHSLKGIALARADQLAMCPGFGEQKVKRLQQAFVQPFIVKQKKK
ncbi:excision repair cross-complementing 1-like protein [Fennellomyces sp. T-0311]|nr:excision repair cross-complementing 1-like protein [Fennellomyces sp. T-0311]